MSVPAISALPEPPVRADAPVDFTAKADAFMAALPPMVVQVNASLVWVEARAGEISGWASTASSAATTASEKRDEAVAAASTATLRRDEAADAALAASNSAGSAAASVGAAAGHANAADLSRQAAAASAGLAADARDAAQSWAEQAEATVVADVIADGAISTYQVRSSMSASRGHFTAVPVSADAAVGALDFAQIINDAASVIVEIPATPLEGQMVMVANLTNRYDHAINVGANKVKGQDAGGLVVIDKQFITITLKFINSAYGWEVMQ